MSHKWKQSEAGPDVLLTLDSVTSDTRAVYRDQWNRRWDATRKGGRVGYQFRKGEVPQVWNNEKGEYVPI